jgi:hypothetical protein
MFGLQKAKGWIMALAAIWEGLQTPWRPGAAALWGLARKRLPAGPSEWHSLPERWFVLLPEGCGLQDAVAGMDHRVRFKRSF